MKLYVYRVFHKFSPKTNILPNIVKKKPLTTTLFSFRIGGSRLRNEFLSFFASKKWGFRFPKLRFRNFFGFFKAKIFIQRARFHFLKYYSFNIRGNVFSRFVMASKMYTAEAILKYFNADMILGRYDDFFSKKRLKRLLRTYKLKKKKNFGRLWFMLYKHRIFSQTTRKRRLKCQLRDSVSFSNQTDFRRPSSFSNLSLEDHMNSDAFSVYNWKLIN